MKNKNLFLVLILIFTVILSGCSFSIDFNRPNTSDDSSSEVLDDFEFVTDNKMELVSSSPRDYYCLTLYSGETYQIKTTIDEKLGDDYYFVYKSDDDITGKFTLSDTGFIETSSSMEKGEVFSIDVDLYKKGSYAKVANKYFIFSLLVGEYANITLTNENLTYDNDSSTYYLTMESGSSFNISYSISSNVSYVLTFGLNDSSYSSFINVDNEGKITTTKTNEDKEAIITIKLIGQNGTLCHVYLNVKVLKSVSFENELEVFDKSNLNEINDGDVLDLYINQELSFDVIFNGVSKTNVITVKDSSVIELDNSSNTIKGIKIGETEITFSYEDKKIVITINVINDLLIALEANNEGADFVIINDELHYLNNLFAIYESGIKKEITDNSLIETSFEHKDDNYKTVTFIYEEEGEIAIVSYDVKYYNANKYIYNDTTYENADYLNNYYNGSVSPLPNKGDVKILVIPVWFKDSNLFFKESQKDQILEDIEYVMDGDRPESEYYSVRQYYEKQSFGNIKMNFSFSDFYISDTSYQDYTDNIDYKISNTHELGTQAISWYFATSNDTFSDYDLNNDGYLDGVVLYYAANQYGSSSEENKSVAFEVGNNDNHNYSFNTLAFCPVAGLYGLEKKDPTNQLKVEDLSKTYSKSFKRNDRTVIHEIGHMFGNDDLYEDQFSKERYSPAGGFSMQDDNYGGFDPYHINRIGWSKPQIYASSDYNLGDKITINLKDYQSSGQNIILTNKWNYFNSLYDEYLILELFTPTGLNEFDSKEFFMSSIEEGIRLWHVNAMLENIHDSENKTSEIITGKQYKMAYSNYDVESEFDVLHMIRNNENETYNASSKLYQGDYLFNEGDSFDMGLFKSQFKNGTKLDNGEKLGWKFDVEHIFNNVDGTYNAIITLERTDNVRTDFAKKVALNRSDLDIPTNEEDYSDEIFGDDSLFSFIYKLVTPPSSYAQNYPISSNGMCLFASSDGNGGYIDLRINQIEGKQVYINSISVTYSRLTNASLTIISNDSVVSGTKFTPSDDSLYGYTYEVNAPYIRIQNQYNETINHWSVIALYDLEINYTIK